MPTGRARAAGRTRARGPARARAEAARAKGEGAPVFAYLPAPVYALATSAQATRTMNLVSYCAPVSIAPPRFALGLYKGTLSHELFLENRRGVLALLRPCHAPLSNLLGKTSGRDVDKAKAARDRGFDTVEAFGEEVLASAAGVVELTWPRDREPVDCGDHTVVICDVARHWTAPDVASTARADALDVLGVRRVLAGRVDGAAGSVAGGDGGVPLRCRVPLGL